MTHAVVGTLLHTATLPTPVMPPTSTRLSTMRRVGDLSSHESLYIFTDESGFFYLDGVAKGEYQFSLYLPRVVRMTPHRYPHKH